MKFKVKDKVKVKTNVIYWGDQYAGQVGSVINIYKKHNWPYYVEFAHTHDWFSADELELVNPKE